MARLVADGVVARLRAWHVKRSYGYAGDGINPLLGALQRAPDGPEFVATRHEELAAFAACGHAKYSGEVGVCLATQGPGAIHLLAGLYDAKLDRRPVVAIVGQVVSSALGSGYLQEVDLHSLFKDVCAQYVQTVFSPEQVEMVLDNAMRTAIATSTPTCVIIPHDVQQAEMPDEPEHSHGVVPSPAVVARPVITAPEHQLRRAAEVLNAGQRVAVLAGAGVAGAAEQVTAVVDRLAAGLTVSLLGKPLLDESAPWHTGVMGHLGTTASAELMRDCDTLLIVGCNDPWTEFYPAPGQCRAVQIDIDARVVGAKYPVEAPVIGDVAAALSALLPLLRTRDDRSFADRMGAASARWDRLAADRAAAPGEALNPERVVRALSDALPANAQVAVDVGSVTYWYARQLRLPVGVPAHLSAYLASMGCAMPYGLAAKLHAPDRPVVALVGDGAMQMSGLLELITVADRWPQWRDPRFVVLVLHNEDLAEVSWEQREMEGNPRFAPSQSVPSFPYAAHAELLGLRGIRVTDPAEVAGAWRTAFAADRPVVIEAVADSGDPMMPPLLPRPKLESMLSAVAAEPGGAALADRIRRQHEAEGESPSGAR
ncbi:thiamine pyrophosphate-requiring protein [Mycobacterium sp. MYCO198283]|uniref:thiamine pyrophosphate-requiring protein n=1 Tax=Mycobacterium sp. MYCO198283 TaxID=2883505 RepID=UPI001E3CD49B|nr:thiamine pyrophosphate-requiring protein [Mycobacterium sp. MYCO198283]MCG5433255.1 thiamine pyrophosphate-requiring protein [Mycobacterium sp. MYCO198283]